MTDPFISFEKMAELYTFERDWLFEKFLVKLNTHRHLLLTADQHWGIQEYVKELGFQLEEKHQDIQICYVDVRLAQTSASFLKLFQASLFHKFQELESLGDIYSGSLNTLKLPSIIARKKRIRVGVFLSNSHLFHRYKDADSFLRTLRLYFQDQKKCIFCLYGNDTSYIRELVHTPGPLSGLGQLFELRHDPTKHRSASVRRIFHDQNKSIAYTTSIHMSYTVDNDPFYLKLLAWHALIRTRNHCTEKTVDEALNDLILHFEHHFRRIVEGLTIKQLSFLKASIEVGYKLCSEAILKAYQLGSSSNVARIKQSLENMDIIDTGSHDAGKHDTVFVDPVFRKWMKIRYFKIDSVPLSHGKTLK
ncbi:MAG: hypothetical protein DRJ29_05805 [Bacteroidetes bacterium]|nr:MAG: hypothetical protein DRI98_15040 [Bacteroidota bacterium]RLD94434.1 MAG: hypothetical protein DRJ29_05805 [Bacteroidota bacterium]